MDYEVKADPLEAAFEAAVVPAAIVRPQLAAGDAANPARSAFSPAYRGIAYAVFEGLQLAEFGNRIPSLTFEVFEREDTLPLHAIINDVSGQFISGTTSETLGGYAVQGRDIRTSIEPLAIRPLPPCHLNVKFDSGQNMEIWWKRRSRLDRGWRDYADLPIDEPQLVFDVQIESGPTLLATFQSQSENLEISSATIGSWGLASGAPLTISVQQRGAYAVSATASMSIILP